MPESTILSSNKYSNVICNQEFIQNWFSARKNGSSDNDNKLRENHTKELDTVIEEPEPGEVYICNMLTIISCQDPEVVSTNARNHC